MSSTVDFSSFPALAPFNTHLKPENPASLTVPVRNGLPTPPSDMTGVTYNAMPVAYAGNPTGMPAHLYGNSRPSGVISSSSMMTAMKPQLHVPSTKEAPSTEPVSQKKSTSSRGSQLRIPSSINNTKGNLAEFAAQVWIPFYGYDMVTCTDINFFTQMTCLFWFEKTSKLQAIEDHQNPVPSLVAEAIPTVGFQKWVATILSTTQVSQNVILLALLFIYRLKKFNSGVKGKKGSEFRLMTVALMLGNKCESPYRTDRSRCESPGWIYLLTHL